MRLILLLSIILLSACENRKETIANRQQAIKKEMADVNGFYYKKIDSLENVKNADTDSAKLQEIAEEISSFDEKRSAKLLEFQNEFDSLEAELK